MSDIPPCPSWCVSAHSAYDGEESWLHLGEPVVVAEGLTAVLCLSTDPQTGAADGPYVLVGTRELSLPETTRLAGELRRLVSRARDDEAEPRACAVVTATDEPAR